MPTIGDIRQELYSKVEIPTFTFDALSNNDKVCHLLSASSIINYSAKACHEILNQRRKRLYKYVLNVNMYKTLPLHMF